jgi:hypothetical protein
VNTAAAVDLAAGPSTARVCATCGEPLTYSGRGRPPVTHAGSCRRSYETQRDEARRWDRYEEALRDAAVRSPFVGPEDIDTDHDDDGSGFMSRLGDAGYAPLYDDEREGVPVHERARTAHRDEVLASLSRHPGLSAPTDAAEALPACFRCPLLAHVEGVVAVFTTETLSGLFGAAGRYGDDVRLRRHLAEDDTAALMARRPV